MYSEFLQLIHNYYAENLCNYLGNIPNVTDPFPSRSKSWKTILCWAPGLHSKASNAKNSLNEIKLQEKQRVSWILICLRNFSHFPFLNPLTPWSNCHSPYCEPYNSFNVSSESLVMDQLIITKLIFFFILITYLVDIVSIL